MHKIDELKIYTHKRNESEIFLKSLLKISDTRFTASFCTQLNHPHYDDFYATKNDVNPMFLLECARQVETYVSHVMLGVPLESKFILKSWQIVSRTIRYIKTNIDNLSADIFIDWPPGKNSRGNVFTTIFKMGNEPISYVRIVVGYISNESYRLIRGRSHSSTTISPRLILAPTEKVGYSDALNVSIASVNCTHDNFICAFVLRDNNKSYNDHPQDHITGVNLTEAAKQTCYLYESTIKNIKSNRLTTELISGYFYKYVEKTTSCHLKIDFKESDINNDFFIVDTIQNNKVVANFTLKLARIYE
ncbi:AfsA-related hotdog domain-containing protein [Serratia fonticola]|uniref:AfsA-related hotdog domain-containing protein n=1 Tax=Serratia fonticola TaxID=47917 RepID=UPI001C44E922|nr:AfsA-related hotdog domain-containing protein [Serratia fonticola]QXN64648.1 hypothetical protein J8M99_11745 [Serratia fonticola]